MSLPNAFVTLLTTNTYLPGALVLLHALHEIHPAPRDFKIVCLVTPETVDAKTIGQLRQAGYDLVIGVEPIGSGVPGQDALRLMGRPDLNLALTKLHIFRLYTLFSTIIYLDADVLPIRPLSHLFESTSPHILSACPDTGWPDCFNSGVMVIRPREVDWNGIRTMLKNGEDDSGVYTSSSNGSFDGADQGLLNEYFSEEGPGGDWNRLPFIYNVTPSAAYQYAPAYKRYGHKISAVHFIGPNKPWSNVQNRPAGMSSPTGQPQIFDYPSLIDRWYTIYDKYVRPTAAHSPDISKRFNVPETQAVWNQPGGGIKVVPSQPEDRMDLEQLRDATMWGIVSSLGNTGQYTSMPLEGRVDLIMPKPKPKVTFAPIDVTAANDDDPSSQEIPTSDPSAIESPRTIVAPIPQTIEQQVVKPSFWDASRYSPPKDMGPEMASGMNSYYAPAWEEPVQQQSSWYQAPPQPQQEPYYPTLPSNVQHDQWYGQWTSSQPDPGAVTAVFPWEQSHQKAQRVFPHEAAPPIRQFSNISATSPSIQVQSATPPSITSPQRRSSPPPLNRPPPEPPKSMAEAMASYTNAWDSDPSIKQYIDRLTGKSARESARDAIKSVPGTPRSSSGNFSRKRDPSEHRSSASDFGDDEDDGSEGDGDERRSSPTTGSRGSDSGDSTSQEVTRGTPKYHRNPNYRDRHAQTERTVMADAVVQVAPGGGPSPAIRTVGLPRFAGTNVSTGTIPSGGTSKGGAGGGGYKSTGSGSGTGLTGMDTIPPKRPSIEKIDTSSASEAAAVVAGKTRTKRGPSISTPLSSQAIPTLKSLQSNFGAPMGSMPSHHQRSGSTSIGIAGNGSGNGGSGGNGSNGGGNGKQFPISSPSPPMQNSGLEGISGQPVKPSRTFDPSTDVDARKRETQEVLTRFMKVGSFARSGGAGNGGKMV